MTCWLPDVRLLFLTALFSKSSQFGKLGKRPYSNHERDRAHRAKAALPDSQWLSPLEGLQAHPVPHLSQPTGLEPEPTATATRSTCQGDCPSSDSVSASSCRGGSPDPMPNFQSVHDWKTQCFRCSPWFRSAMTVSCVKRKALTSCSASSRNHISGWDLLLRAQETTQGRHRLSA